MILYNDGLNGLNGLYPPELLSDYVDYFSHRHKKAFPACEERLNQNWTLFV